MVPRGPDEGSRPGRENKPSKGEFSDETPPSMEPLGSCGVPGKGARLLDSQANQLQEVTEGVLVRLFQCSEAAPQIELVGHGVNDWLESGK